jgi:drug/metabolite transporter (DMT)-like permease
MLGRRDHPEMFALPLRSRSTLPSLDLVLLLLLGAIWGSAFLLSRIVSSEVGPAWAAEGRVAIAALVLAVPFGRSTVTAARGRMRQFLVIGATFAAIPFTLISFASLALPVATGTLLNGMTPVFTAIVAAAFLGERIRPRVGLGLAAGFAAVAVLVGWSPLPPGSGTLLAALAALGAALSYAVAGTYARRNLRDVGPAQLATGMLAAGAVLILPVALLTGGAPAEPTPGAWVALLLLAIPASALAWPMFLSIHRRSGPTAASTVTFVIPAYGIAWGSLLAGEVIGPEVVAAATLILMSLWLVLGLPLPAILTGRGPAVLGSATHRAQHRFGIAHA